MYHITSITKKGRHKWIFDVKEPQFLDYIRYLRHLLKYRYKSVLIIENIIIIEFTESNTYNLNYEI